MSDKSALRKDGMHDKDGRTAKQLKEEEDIEAKQLTTAAAEGDVDVNEDVDDAVQDPETMLKFYEYENQNFKANVESLEVVRKHLLERIEKYEKDAQKLQKKVLNLQQSVDLERKAGEGLKKKAGLLEVELPALKEEIANYKSEALRSRGILAQNEIDLNNDRAKRLQILHENQILVDRNKFLEEEFKRKEEELRLSHQNQLKGLQSLESVMVSDSTLQLLIKEQNSSLITMASELQNMQTQCRELTNTNHGFDVEVGSLNSTVRAQEEEIRRLRGIVLMNQTKTVSLRNTASRNARTRNRDSASASASGTRNISSSSGGRNIGSGGPRKDSTQSHTSNSFAFACDPQSSFDAVNKLLSDYTIDPRSQTEFGTHFSKAEKMSVYRNKTPGCDNTKHSRATYVSNISNSRPSPKLPQRRRKDDDSGCDSEGDFSDEDETDQQQEVPLLAPTRTFGHPDSYVNPMQELEELTAFNQNIVETKRLGAQGLSPVANPYLPVHNKIIVNKNVRDKSRPSSTTLTAKRASTGSRGGFSTGKYDYAAAAAAGLTGTTPALAKTMPNLPGIYAGAADMTLSQGSRGFSPSPSPGGYIGSVSGGGSSLASANGLKSIASAPNMSMSSSSANNNNTNNSATIGHGKTTGSVTPSIPSCTSTVRSLYVGQGLGMKHANTQQYTLPSGSTKSMLQKILGDRDF